MSAAHATDTPGSHGTVPMVPKALVVCFAAPFGAWASGSGNSLLHPTPYDSRGTSGRPARTETRRGGGMSPGRAVRGHAEQAACSGIPKGACRPSEDAERSSAGREEPARRPRPGEAPAWGAQGRPQTPRHGERWRGARRELGGAADTGPGLQAGRAFGLSLSRRAIRNAEEEESCHHRTPAFYKRAETRTPRLWTVRGSGSVRLLPGPKCRREK